MHTENTKSFIPIFFIRKFSHACFCKNYCFNLYFEYFFFSVLYQCFDGLFHAMPRHVHGPISGLIFACLIYRIHASHSRGNCFILPSVILYCSVILIYDKIRFSLAAVCLSDPCKNCSVKLTDVSAFNSLL